MKPTTKQPLSLALFSALLHFCTAAPLDLHSRSFEYRQLEDRSLQRRDCAATDACTRTHLDVTTHKPYVQFVQTSTDGQNNPDNEIVFDFHNCMSGGKIGDPKIALQWHNGKSLETGAVQQCQSWLLRELSQDLGGTLPSTQIFAVQISNSSVNYGWHNVEDTPGFLQLDPLWTTEQQFILDCQLGPSTGPNLGSQCLIKMRTSTVYGQQSKSWQCLAIGPVSDTDPNAGKLTSGTCDQGNANMVFNVRSVADNFSTKPALVFGMA